MPESINPYAAPQTPLQELPSAIKLPTAKNRNYLLQGIVAGFQLGGLASIFIALFMLFDWGKESSPLRLLTILVCVMFFSTLIGTLIGGIVQLLSLVFGGARRAGTEHPARQVFDNTGFTPPTML